MNITPFILFNIPRSEVEACDTAPFIKKMEPFVEDPQPHHIGAFVFMVDGYNDLPEGIYEIPAVRAYFRKLDNEWPYLLFFANIEMETLAVITWCLMDNITCGKSPGTPAITRYTPEELMEWIAKRITGLALLMEKAHKMNLSEDFSEKATNPCDCAMKSRTINILKAYNF